MAPPKKRRKVKPPVRTLVEHPELILKAVREARVESQKQLREQLRQLRQDVEQIQNSDQTPLHVFPAEIWKLVFANLKVNDLANCSRASPSFSRMINSTPQELLLGKVLPLLQPHFDTFPYYVCREVCPKWSAAIKDFFQAKGRVGVSVYSALEALTKEPEPDARHKADEVHDVPAEAMSDDTPKTITSYDLIAINLRLFRDWLYSPPKNLFTLNLCGHRIWRLDLELKGNYKSKKLYSWCVTALAKCAHLKVLRLRSNDAGSSILDNGVNDQLKLKMGTSLEHLVINQGIPGIDTVQNYLLRRFSRRLKRIDLGVWNSKLYKTYKWTNLTEARILGDMDKTCLWEMDFPKLHKISFILDSRSELPLLFKVINKFEALTHLSLELKTGFMDTWKVAPLDMLTSNKIITLDITSKKLNQNRDVPLLFPIIRDLKWRYEGIEPAEPKSEFHIQIFRNMYESNIWTVLPHLQKLILQSFMAKEVTQTFTREEYIWQTEKYSIGIQWQLGRIHEHLKAARRERVKKKMAEDKVAIENGSQVKSSRNDALLEQVSLFIIPYLASTDILTCRLVCKTWTRLVGDRHLENCEHYPLYHFSIPIANPQKKFKEFLEQHQREPIFGWSVELEIEKSSNNCVNSLQTLLDSLGNRIRFLTISTQVTLEMLDAFGILYKCLKHCPNLRGLSLKINALESTERKKIFKMQSQRFFKPPNLTWISTFGRENGYLIPLNILLEDLEESFARQITVWKQDQSCENDIVTFFPNLKEWTVRKYETESLDKGKTYPWRIAENLKKLHICITGQQLSLTDLKWIAVRYKKLQFLELQFTDAFSGLKESLTHYDLLGRWDKDKKFRQLFDEDELQNKDCLHKVSELQLVFKNKYQTSLDFLILFPDVKILRIVYGRHAKLLNEESTWKPYERDDELLFDSLPKRTPDKDYVQLVRFFKDETLAEHNSAEIYASNIWSVLGKLQTLEVVCCAAEEKEESMVFKRKM